MKSEEQKEFTRSVWRCPQHENCWRVSRMIAGGSWIDEHLPTAEVMVMAMGCAPSCECWRHTCSGQEGLGIIA